MQILVSIGAVGASTQIGEILPLCDFFVRLSSPVLSFFSRECAQVEPLNRFSCCMAQTTCFVITLLPIVRLLRNLAGRCKMACLYISRKRNRKYNFNMAAVRIPKPEVVYLSCGLRYLIEIWHANKFPSS